MFGDYCEECTDGTECTKAFPTYFIDKSDRSIRTCAEKIRNCHVCDQFGESCLECRSDNGLKFDLVDNKCKSACNERQRLTPENECVQCGNYEIADLLDEQKCIKPECGNRQILLISGICQECPAYKIVDKSGNEQ